MFNKDELIIDKVRSMTAHDLSNGQLLFRLTQLEEPTLTTTAEGDEVVDALGSRITTLYRAKNGTFGATNSLFSSNLLAEQFGSEKQIGGLKDFKYGNAEDSSAKLTDYSYEILTIPSTGDDAGKVKLAKKASGTIKYIYSIENNQIGTMYKAGTEVSATEFLVDNTGDVTVITVPTGLTGKVFVEYEFENVNAMRIVNKASEFPRAVSLIIYAYFKDVCNENLVYSGKIIVAKAKLNPEQIEVALTSTGKHPFEFVINKDYCEEDAELFSVVISG